MILVTMIIHHIVFCLLNNNFGQFVSKIYMCARFAVLTEENAMKAKSPSNVCQCRAVHSLHAGALAHHNLTSLQSAQATQHQ